MEFDSMLDTRYLATNSGTHFLCEEYEWTVQDQELVLLLVYTVKLPLCQAAWSQNPEHSTAELT
jgi:hypothetical protein